MIKKIMVKACIFFTEFTIFNKFFQISLESNKMKSNFLIILILTVLPTRFLLAASYDTLPKNVNTLVFKQVIVSKIESQFNEKGNNETLNLKEEFKSSRLEEISTVVKTYFDELKAISPESYKNFSLGEFSAKVAADITAQGVGYGFGLTDRLTIYGALPIYHIQTEIRFQQTKASNLDLVKSTVKNANTDTALGKFVKDLTLQLPHTNEEFIQSLVTNYYGYKPIGKWEKDAIGDAEIGFVYRLTDYTDRGASLSAGIVFPTGSPDDPDSIQDIATGDGQYDTFAEIASGISFFNNSLQFDLKGRYTYQFESEKEVRWIDDASLPFSQTKRSVKQKLGNKIDTSLTATYLPTYWMNLYSSYILGTTGQTDYYELTNPDVKKALESNTSSNAQWIKIGLGFSTVEAFKRKKFDLPMDIGVSVQRLMNAKNTASYDRVDFDFKLYF